MAEQSGEMENLVSIQKLAEFYTGRRVFVTGHTGFKGSWLTAILQSWGAVVKGYALEPVNQEGLFSYLPTTQLTSVISDVRDRERLFSEVASFEPEIVFHLAAQPLVRRSYQLPSETFDVNVTGTANLLESVTRLKNRCAVVVVTTDKVYKNREQDVLYAEDDELGGYDPYSASKACTELVVESFRNSFFNPGDHAKHQKSIASARAGNVIGGGDWSEDRIVPDIARSLLTGQTVAVRNPESVRPWQHVLEPLHGYLMLAEALHRDGVNYASAFNFGPVPGDHLRVKELVQQAIDIWGAGEWKDVSDKEAPHEAILLKLNITKAAEVLRWKPKMSASTAVTLAIEWYKQPQARRLATALRQIEEYFVA
jgi:CDP-glucose 4,6-dehydratase